MVLDCEVYMPEINVRAWAVFWCDECDVDYDVTKEWVEHLKKDEA